MTLKQILEHIYTNQKKMLPESSGFNSKKCIPYTMATIIYRHGAGIEYNRLRKLSYEIHRGKGACYNGYLSNLQKVLAPVGVHISINQHPNGEKFVSMTM